MNLQLKISKAAFWLERTTLLGWLKLLMLPVSAWFIFYVLNSDLIAGTAYRVSFALSAVFLFFFVIARVSMWLAKLPGDKCVIAAFDKDNLHLALEEKAEFPVSKLMAINFSENTLFLGIKWPESKNIVTIVTADGVRELETNFSYAPLRVFLRQVDKVIKTPRAD